MEKIKNTIGKKLSPVLVEIETALFENQTYFEKLNIDSKPNFTLEGFRAGLKIFMDVCLDKMYENDLKNNKSLNEMEQHAYDFGTAIKILISDYLNIDTTKLY